MSITLPPLPEHSKNHPDFLPCPHCGGTDIRVDCHRGAGRGIHHQGADVWSMCCRSCGAAAPNRYSREVLLAAWNRRAAVEADRANRPQTVPDELREAAAAVTQHWDSPLWKVAQHTGVFIHRLRAALAAVEAAPVALAQPAEPQDVPSDLIIEVAEAMQVRRILEQIKQVAATWPPSDKPLAFASGWFLCCEEIFYRVTGEQWRMDEDEPQIRAAIPLKRFASAAANEALAGVAQAQPESAPVRVPMTPDEAGQLWRAVHAARSAGGDHHETSYVAFARAVELHYGIGSAT